MFDLLLKGGHALDPGQGIDARLDIAITDGRIASISPDIPDSDAARTLRIDRPGRYVTPGLIDLHTHVAFGATTDGVGANFADPDIIGVKSGVTTLLDAGSCGVGNFGVFRNYILPKARTRVLCFINAGSFAFMLPNRTDVNSIEEIDRDAIAKCIDANPGLVAGIKLRAVGPIMNEHGEEIVELVKAITREHRVPLMVHIGDLAANSHPSPERFDQLTRFLLQRFDSNDILTHLCTPSRGGVLDSSRNPIPELAEARANGVTLDSALGMGNFGYEVAARQAQLGIFPDTISSDLTMPSSRFHSLLECMAKFMAVGYSLNDVVKMTTANAAKAIGLSDTIGALAVGREADVTVLDHITGDFKFTDTTKTVFYGHDGLVPVHTLRSGIEYAPHWGTHPWGWAPESI